MTTSLSCASSARAFECSKLARLCSSASSRLLMVPTSAARACAVCCGVDGLGRFGSRTGLVVMDVDAVVGVRGLS